MTAVAPATADWLKAAALYTAAVDPTAASWGDSVTETEIISPLALEADASAEAARQLGFLAGPLAIDEHLVSGDQAGLIGQTVLLAGDRLGYEAEAVAFVIGAVESDGLTVLTVLRRL